ncbi:MAG: hypothetical protein CL727_03380 [Chloroflexi bacterium]|jgi:hypothetical protein|nr:hypothetical protein [Chloroflexota bacterium]|tara:strand:- start:327 stop:506 length:180 start_codon:yes stop_codon:yes gene_type:complete
MFARDIDVILAGTKPNVEYLTDVEWMRWFNKENFLPENGETMLLPLLVFHAIKRMALST